MSKIAEILWRLLEDVGPMIEQEHVDQAEAEIEQSRWTPRSDGLPEEPEENMYMLIRHPGGEIKLWWYSAHNKEWTTTKERMTHQQFVYHIRKYGITNYQPITPPKEVL